MSSTSNAFAEGNSGTQVGINHGQIYFSSAPQETPQQSVDNGSHRPVSVKETITNYVEVLRSLAFPEMLDRRDNIEPCHPDTCQWILELEKYKSWRSQSRGLLWIKGKPGAGKSTLMLFLHDELKRDVDHGIRLEFFFTARATEMQRIPLGMLRSLLSQIFDRDATIRPQVRDAYEQRCRHFGYGEREWEWPRVVLEELLAGTILASASRRYVMIFVDALDEAGAESAQYLAAYFHRLIDRAEKQDVAVQICISCRHYPIMQSDPAREICVEDHNHDDIARYIKDILTDTDVGDGPGQDTREALAEQLIRQCNGVFQWAHLVMPLIRQKILEGESFDDIRCWLHEVPVGLEDVYTYILNNVIEGRNRAQSFLLFQWVSLAERPLTVTEMRYALAAQNTELAFPPKTWEKIDGFVESNGRMKRRIQVLSGGLAEVISTVDYHENVTGTVHEIVHETVQVVHQSVNDFLLAKGLGLLCHNIGTSTLPMDGERIIFQCQATLYRTCLVYLATVHMAQKIPDKQDVIQDHPLLDYATYNLFVHAEKAADSRADVLQNEQDILQRVIGPWVQIYRIKYRSSKRCPQEDTTILHMAAAANLVDVIESVVSNGTDVMEKDRIGNTAFHLAASQGHITVGKILREKGADREAKNANGITPLTEAARCGHVRFVEWLLHEGVKVETSARSEGALQAASLEGHQRVVAILLGAGADVNVQGGEYGNALQAAAYGENTEIVQMLLEAHADVNAQGVQMLLDALADVNTQGGHYGNALQAAAYRGTTEIVQMLLDALADVNTQGGHYGNALQAAAYRGTTEIVQMLLDALADVNTQGGHYGNALQAAAYRGTTEIVQMLLDALADVNTQGGHYGNALQAAAYRGTTEIVQMLLDALADVNTQGGHYGNALQAAAYRGTTEIVQMLLDALADVNTQGGHYGNALQAAAYRGTTEIVQMLLDALADVNTQGGHYGNALQAAAYRGTTEIVQMLLDALADVNTQGGHYGNALQAAAYRGTTEIVQMLLDALADVNTQGGHYGNALQAAAYRGTTEIVQMLLDALADVNTQGGHYGNALQAAAYRGTTEIVQMLLDALADVNTQGGHYGNALQAAAYRGTTEIVQMLLDALADVNTQGGHYGNALQAAAYRGTTEIVQMLLDALADVNTQGGHYGNALQAAAYRGNTEIVQMLLEAHADVNAQGGICGSPLLAAVQGGHADSVRILLHAGADVLLANEHGQTPLHIAAFENQLDLLNRFTLLASGINSRDKFLQPPLHLAICLGHIEFAEKLLHLGANPSLPDGYGRNILDWVVGNESLMHHIQNNCPPIVVTPKETQELTKYPYHSLLHPNQEHKTFEVLYVPDNDSRLTSSKSEQLSHFLSKIVHELSAPNTDITEAEPPNDSVSSPAPKKTVLVSRAILGRATLSYALFFGLLAVLLRYWFF
ncbi:NACHT nucleoside triphosphatase [Penicillium camemberti]|uniref:NACHT nucleoside triphosphatase n=1 Tax=Penicillium camemberti (strain FM 013) TaxID=1429867 RepID=A0A0G4P4U6_PENC3|nr:NACHT nucleoside triphosphatase [Penicillium camemberti]